MDDEEDFFGSDAEDDEKKKGDDDKKSHFQREIRALLYGFGDDAKPYDKTVETLEIIVKHYIEAFCDKALEVGKPGRITIDEIHYLMRRDYKKITRELLSMSEELKKARKYFDEYKAPI